MLTEESVKHAIYDDKMRDIIIKVLPIAKADNDLLAFYDFMKDKFYFTELSLTDEEQEKMLKLASVIMPGRLANEICNIIINAKNPEKTTDFMQRLSEAKKQMFMEIMLNITILKYDSNEMTEDEKSNTKMLVVSWYTMKDMSKMQCVIL